MAANGTNGSLAAPLLSERSGSTNTLAKERRSSVSKEELTKINMLLENEDMDLMKRIEKLNLATEYLAFKERYLAWRQGDAKGAHGESTAAHLRENIRHNIAGLVYFSQEEWEFKRTMSYWIAVTFYEGAIFYTISSFAFNQPEMLGKVFAAVTTGGYLAGKFLYFICTYLMCLECVNFASSEIDTGRDLSSLSDVESSQNDKKDDQFYLNPFRYQVAFARLEAAGAGRYPYWIAVFYLVGVIIFFTGLMSELVPGIPDAWRAIYKNASFVVGSFLFFLGGYLEMVAAVEGYKGAQKRNAEPSRLGIVCGTLNFFAGGSLLVGAYYAYSVLALTNIWFGIGSGIYVVSSALMIKMWKDEQYGLTFLPLLNNIRPKGSPKRESPFSWRGLLFVNLCCFCGAFSGYNTFIEIMNFQRWLVGPDENSFHTHGGFRSFQLAFNEFMPCFFAHAMLMIMAAVSRVPKMQPYRKLYKMLRYSLVFLCINSFCTFVEFIRQEIKE